jgi:16S rRNA (guanine527-N7)-methyltransferase
MRIPAFSLPSPALRRFEPIAPRFICCTFTPSQASRGASPGASQDLLSVVSLRANVSEANVAKLQELGKIVLAANKTTNLTAVRTEDGLIVRHLVDALGLLPLIDSMKVRTVVDLGSGAGFPGLVLAICRPWSLTLLEASRKKSRFHESAISELGLSNVESVWGRAEELGHDVRYRESFDVCVARAVAQMPVLAELALPLVRVGGALVAQKSVERGGRRQEIESASTAFAKLGGVLEDVEFTWTGDLVRAHVPSEADGAEDQLQRAFVTVRKSQPTSQRYPRLAGTPKKNPL